MGRSKKSIYIVIFIVVAVSLLSCSGNNEVAHDTAATESGIDIIGGMEGEDWEENTEKGFLIIWKEGITLTGTAEADLRVVCKSDVSSLEIKDLEADGNNVVISASPENVSQFILNVSGDNSLTNIQSMESILLKGDINGGHLELSGGIRSGKDLMIKNVSITAGGLRAFENVEICGKSKVFLRQSADEEELLLHARLYAGKHLNISLTSEGFVDIQNTGQYFPVLAKKSFTLGKNTIIRCPENGVIANEDTPYGSDCQFILDAAGNDTADVMICNGLEN